MPNDKLNFPQYNDYYGEPVNPTLGQEMYGSGYNGQLQPLPNIYGANPYQTTGSAPVDNGVAPKQNAGSATAQGSLNPAKMGLGAIQIIGGLAQAAKLAKQAVPQYGATADLQFAKSRSGERAKRGFSPQQVGKFQADLSRILNTDFQNSVNQSGGNQATALNARNMGARLRTLNSFAANDAIQQSQNIAQDNAIISQMQSIKNMNDQYAIQRRQANEQAAGAAIKTGTENFASSFDLGQAAKYLAA